MKAPISALLILVFGIHLLYTSGMMMDYLINNAEYLEKCENKNKPKLSCDGKCVLMKKLNQNSNDSSSKSNLVIYRFSIEFNRYCFHNEFNQGIKLLSLSPSIYFNNYHFDSLSDFFRPPKF